MRRDPLPPPHMASAEDAFVLGGLPLHPPDVLGRQLSKVLFSREGERERREKEREVSIRGGRVSYAIPKRANRDNLERNPAQETAL